MEILDAEAVHVHEVAEALAPCLLVGDGPAGAVPGLEGAEHGVAVGVEVSLGRTSGRKHVAILALGLDDLVGLKKVVHGVACKQNTTSF